MKTFFKTFGIGLLVFAGYLYGVYAVRSTVAHRAVFFAIGTCHGQYDGAFAVTGDGHWVGLSKEKLPQKQAEAAIAKFPEFAQAELEVCGSPTTSGSGTI
jgi:hypothetical protein